MTYELAKQLKDAGFSQKISYKVKEFPYIHGENELPGEFGAYNPPLSELIEACGGEFEELSGRYSNEKVHGCKWLATGIEQEPWNPKSNASGKGSTPEEAVAKLWLELNKATKFAKEMLETIKKDNNL